MRRATAGNRCQHGEGTGAVGGQWHERVVGTRIRAGGERQGCQWARGSVSPEDPELAAACRLNHGEVHGYCFGGRGDVTFSRNLKGPLNAVRQCWAVTGPCVEHAARRHSVKGSRRLCSGGGRVLQERRESQKRGHNWVCCCRSNRHQPPPRAGSLALSSHPDRTIANIITMKIGWRPAGWRVRGYLA